MKRLIYLVSALAFGTLMYSCSDTTDCMCTVDDGNGISVRVIKKAAKPISVSDHDGKCSDITSSDLDGQTLLGSCSEE
ncbi:MAG: hypothetical protein IJ748_05290 [Bacteroidales bacterium]|nr:hypothetical protein [Bacteroidales bacterium]